VIEARFDDLTGEAPSFRLTDPAGVLEAMRPEDVLRTLAAAEGAAARGLWVAGFVAYEAAPGLDPSLTVRSRAPEDPFSRLPLAWFAMFQQRQETVLPSPRDEAPPTDAWVPTIDRVVLFGGFQQGFATLFNDTWAYDYEHNRWNDLNPANPPAPRAYHYMALEPPTNRIVLFGGTLNSSETGDEVPINETWIYDVAGNSWNQAFPKESPGPHAWHAISRTSGPVLAFGGGDSRSTWTNDTYLYSSRSNRWDQVPGGSRAGSAVTAVGVASGGRLVRGGRARRGH